MIEPFSLPLLRESDFVERLVLLWTIVESVQCDFDQPVLSAEGITSANTIRHRILVIYTYGRIHCPRRQRHFLRSRFPKGALFALSKATMRNGEHRSSCRIPSRLEQSYPELLGDRHNDHLLTSTWLYQRRDQCHSTSCHQSGTCSYPH